MTTPSPSSYSRMCGCTSDESRLTTIQRSATMQRRDFLANSFFGTAGLWASRLPSATLDAAPTRAAGRKILIAGGNYNTAFVRYMAELTGKTRPKLLFLPTASADRVDGILSWYKTCSTLNVTPMVQESFIASTRQAESW